MKIRQRSEDELYLKARRGIVAAKAIRAGTLITESMLDIKRPGYGISPVDMEQVLGWQTKNHLRADEILTWEILQDADYLLRSVRCCQDCRQKPTLIFGRCAIPRYWYANIACRQWQCVISNVECVNAIGKSKREAIRQAKQAWEKAR